MFVFLSHHSQLKNAGHFIVFRILLCREGQIADLYIVISVITRWIRGLLGCHRRCRRFQDRRSSQQHRFLRTTRRIRILPVH